MDRLATAILRNPRTILIVWTLLTLAVGSGTLQLTSRNNYEGDLPLSDPMIADQARFEASFGNEQVMLVAVESPDLLSAETLRKLDEIASRLSRITGVREFGVTGISTLPVDPLNPGSPTVLDVLRARPSVEARIALLKDLPHVARFLSADGTTTLIAVEISRTASQTDVAAEVQATQDHFEGPERIYVIGDHTVAQAIDSGIEADLSLLLPLACLLIFLSMRLCFGTVRDAGLALCVMLGSVVWTLGLMGHLGVPLNVVTSTLPILLVAIASSYGIHVIRHHARQSGTREVRVRKMLSDLGRPVLLTGLTSAVGTLSLLLFEVHSIREFGLFASLGIVAATAGALVFLPAALACLTVREHHPKESTRVQDLLNGVGQAACRHRTLTFLGCAAVILVSVVGITRIQIGMDPASMFPAGHPVREATIVLNKRFSGCRYFDVMVDFGVAGGALEPEAISVIRTFADAAGNLDDVTAVYSAADVVVPGIPGTVFRPALTASRLVDADARRTRITVMTAATDQVEQERLYERLRELAAQHTPNRFAVFFAGPVLRWIAQNRYVSIGKVLSLLAASICVLAFCTVAFRCLRTGFLSTVPLLVSTVATFGVMGWTGIRLNMATAITTSIGLGIGIDFGIHFMSQLRRELTVAPTESAVAATMARTGHAILYDVGSNLLGFGVLVFSVFGPVRDFGLLISLTMLTCAVGTLVLLPAAAPWIKESSTEEQTSLSITPAVEAA